MPNVHRAPEALAVPMGSRGCAGMLPARRMAWYGSKHGQRDRVSSTQTFARAARNPLETTIRAVHCGRHCIVAFRLGALRRRALNAEMLHSVDRRQHDTGTCEKRGQGMEWEIADIEGPDGAENNMGDPLLASEYEKQDSGDEPGTSEEGVYRNKEPHYAATPEMTAAASHLHC